MLQKSEEMLRSTFASMDDLVFTLDKEDNFTTFYQPLQKGIYVSPGQFLGKNYHEVLPPNVISLLDPAVANIRETGETQQIEYALDLPGGSAWFSAKISMRRDAAGSYDGVTIVARDITASWEAGRKNAMLAAIINSSDDAIIGQSLAGVIRIWNPSAERMYGYRPDEVAGKNITIIIPPRLQPEMEQIYRTIRKGERVEQCDTVRLRKDGTEIEVSFTISPIHDESGKIIGIATMSHDLTTQREQERALLAFISEATMRLKNPVEQMANRLGEIKDFVRQEDTTCSDVELQLEIQRKNALQIVRNLRDLNAAISDKIRNLPEAFREYMNK